jgi:hypothetical protein
LIAHIRSSAGCAEVSDAADRLIEIASLEESYVEAIVAVEVLEGKRKEKRGKEGR